MAASVSTLVVSWKRRGADERLGRERRLGDAEEQRLGDAGLTAALDDLLVLRLEEVLLDLLVDQEVRVADVLDAHAAEHLTNDDLDVLVVDADALQAVDLLDFVHEPRRELLLALDAQDVVRVRRTVLQRLAGANAVARLHLDVLALGDQVLARLIGDAARRRRLNGVMTTLRLPLVSLPNETSPSISLMMAWSFGLRASKSSATRGRPPVMSCIFVVSRGIFAMTSPASMHVAFLRDDVRADREEVARVERRCSGA